MRKILSCLVLLVLACLTGFPAAAQGDARPVRIIVPYPPGGQTDAMARMVGEHISKTLRRPVVVDNRAGAGGLIGLKAMQAAPADGDTYLFRDLALVVAPMLQKTATYNANTDLVPVATLGRGELYLMVPKDVPVRSAAEFIEWAKKQPDGVTAGNNGINTGAHITAAILAKRAGIKVIHVPYKGNGEATLALITGDSKMQFNAPTDALLGHIRSGAVRVLATAAPLPSPFYPSLPAMKDVVPGAWPFEGYFSMFTVPGSPLDKVAAVARAVEAAVSDPAIKEKFLALNVQPLFKPAPELARDIVRYQAMYGELIRELGLEPQ